MVKTAMIGGEERPLRVTNGVTRKMFRDLGIKKEDELPKIIAKGIEETFNVFKIKLFYALEAGYKATGQPFEHSMDEVGDWIDDMTQEEFFAIPIFQADPTEDGEKK